MNRSSKYLDYVASAKINATKTEWFLPNIRSGRCPTLHFLLWHEVLDEPAEVFVVW